MSITTMSWPFLVIIIIILGGLIVFLVWKNQRDKKKVEDQIKRNYPKTKDEEGENDVEDTRI